MTHRPTFSTRGERVNFDDLRRAARRNVATKPKTAEVASAIEVGDDGKEVFTSGFVPPVAKTPEELTSVTIKRKRKSTTKKETPVEPLVEDDTSEDKEHV